LIIGELNLGIKMVKYTDEYGSAVTFGKENVDEEF
jgi:hypothetical protein